MHSRIFKVVRSTPQGEIYVHPSQPVRLISTHTHLKVITTYTQATLENQSLTDAECTEHYTHTDLEFERDLTEENITITTM